MESSVLNSTVSSSKTFSLVNLHELDIKLFPSEGFSASRVTRVSQNFPVDVSINEHHLSKRNACLSHHCASITSSSSSTESTAI